MYLEGQRDGSVSKGCLWSSMINDLSLIPGSTWWEEGTNTHKSFSDLYMYITVWVLAHTHTINATTTTIIMIIIIRIHGLVFWFLTMSL